MSWNLRQWQLEMETPIGSNQSRLSPDAKIATLKTKSWIYRWKETKVYKILGYDPEICSLITISLRKSNPDESSESYPSKISGKGPRMINMTTGI